jgi:hypothetical protein
VHVDVKALQSKNSTSRARQDERDACSSLDQQTCPRTEECSFVLFVAADVDGILRSMCCHGSCCFLITGSNHQKKLTCMCSLSLKTVRTGNNREQKPKNSEYPRAYGVQARKRAHYVNMNLRSPKMSHVMGYLSQW